MGTCSCPALAGQLLEHTLPYRDDSNAFRHKQGILQTIVSLKKPGRYSSRLFTQLSLC